MIAGIGVDIIEIPRIAQSIARPRFRERVFTETERAYCDTACCAERYAGRFAAKEAIAKALGGGGFHWQDVEILHAENGAPVPRLHGTAREALGDGALHLSISHCHGYAVAQAIVERPDGV